MKKTRICALLAALTVCFLTGQAGAETVGGGTPDGVTAAPPSGTEPAYPGTRVKAEDNVRPTAGDLEIVTYRNLPVRGVFPLRDDAPGCRVQILTRPAHGMVTEENGTFVYTPYQNRTGTDRFTWMAQDAAGAWSEEREVRIEVLRQSSAVVYGDMDGDPAACAAVRLAEEGIWTGPEIGGVRYFSPEETVSRGAMIAMTMAALGREPVSPASVEADETACVPAWSRGYVAAAVEDGVIAGRDGALETGEPVTLAEAAVILDAGIESREPVSPIHGEDRVPVWAAEAVARLEAAGILSPAQAETLGGDHLLTRREAAELLQALTEYRKRDAARTGLFSWTAAN